MGNFCNVAGLMYICDICKDTEEGICRNSIYILKQFLIPEAYLEPSSTPLVEQFNCFRPLTVFPEKLHRGFSTGF